MVISRISILPGVQGARNMKKWLAIPGFQDSTSRLFDIATVGQAAMVMQIVYEGDF
jgi:hypothetical protein